MSVIDRHTVTATIGGIPVEVIEAETTLDRGWSPYAQGTLTIAAPALMAILDPRRRAPITIRHRRRYSDSLTFAEVSTLHAGLTFAEVSEAFNGMTMSQMSALYRTDWNAAGPHGEGGSVVIDAWLTGAARSRTDPDVWRVSWCGDEQRALTRLASAARWTPGGSTVRTIAAEALMRAGLDATLGGSGDAAVAADDDGDMPVWQAGVSCWDYLQPIVAAADLRLYADEARQWHIADDTDPIGSCTIGPEATEVHDTWDTDNGLFYDHAVLVYEWETKTGVQKTAVDAFMGGAVSGYTETVPGRLTRKGRAERIVRRAQQRALSQDWDTVADYTIRPGQAATITPDTATGIVEAVTWTYPAARARVTISTVTTP
ncbi:MAG: hypothetical protein ACK5O2_00850 [Microthrixaceae bacterium]